MSPQADYVVSNGTGAAVRSDINGQLAAIVSNNSGASAPATTYAYQFWADTSTNLLKLRNGANSAFITVGDLTAANLGLATLASPTFTGTATIPTLTVSTAANIPLGSAASPTLYFTGDSNTGLYSPGADQVAISAGGAQKLLVNAGGITTGNGGVFSGDVSSYAVDGLALTFNSNIAQIRACRTGNNYSQLAFFTPGANSGGAQQERVRITSEGLVGIGSATPAELLDVYGTGNTTVRISGSSGGGGDVSQIDFFRIGSNVTSSIKAVRDGGNTSGALTFLTASSGTNSERARLTASGQWLVGTSSDLSGGDADARLQVNGDGGAQILLSRQDFGALTAGTLIGEVVFRSQASGVGETSALIKCEADATQGSGDKPGRLVFSTTADGASSPTERMRIRNDGRIWMGTTSEIRGYNREQLSVKGGSGEAISFQSNALTYAAMVFRDADSGAGTHYIGFWENSSGTNVGAITHNNTNTTYATTSDYRLKENVEPIVGACDRLNQLKPCRFNFIADPDNTVDGFLAHEAQAVVPESVIGQKDAINEDGSVKPQGIDQSKLVPLLTAALQEAIGEIESLKARVAALESA